MRKRTKIDQTVEEYALQTKLHQTDRFRPYAGGRSNQYWTLKGIDRLLNELRYIQKYNRSIGFKELVYYRIIDKKGAVLEQGKI